MTLCPTCGGAGIVEARFPQGRCSRCGQDTYQVCHVGDRLVCPDCFRIIFTPAAATAYPPTIRLTTYDEYLLTSPPEHWARIGVIAPTLTEAHAKYRHAVEQWERLSAAATGEAADE